MKDLRMFQTPVSSIELAKFLSCEHKGPVQEISCVSDISNISPGSLIFLNKYTSELCSADTVIIVNNSIREQLSGDKTFILSSNPKLDFAKVVSHFLLTTSSWSDGEKNSYIHPSAKIDENVSIGPGAVIEAGAEINTGTIIGANTVIKKAVRIGHNCIISDGSIIGNDGLTIQRDEQGNTFPLRHVGELIIGNNVEIGPKATIGRATLSTAVVEEGVIMGPQVNLGHNGYVEKNVIITGCSSISGGVHIGEESWLGTNCSIIQKITLGKRCTIGLGACVTRDVPDGQTVTGFPAMSLRQLHMARKNFTS